jgi:hypothetical protein
VSGAKSLRLLALPLGAALLAAGCSGGGPAVSLQPNSAAPSAAATTAAPAATTPAAAAGPVAPLTGQPVAAAVADRPAIAVSLRLESAVGLDKADLVYQEFETPTVVRALALFQSRDATEIGPLGGVRPADPALLPSLRAIYANTGGASGTEELLAKAHVAQVRTGFSPGPMASTAGVLAAAPAGSPPPPQAVLPVAATGDAFTSTKAAKARTITVTAPGAQPQTWTYSPTAKRWSLAGVAGVAVSNLILQNVEYKEVRLRDPDRTAQSARVLGRGSCSAVSAETITPCSWYKRAAGAVTGYVDAAAVPLRFAAGPSWVVLLPPGSTVSPR